MLSCLLFKAKVDRKIHGIKISRSSPFITHLVFVDDIILYSRANAFELANLWDILKKKMTYGWVSM